MTALVLAVVFGWATFGFAIMFVGAVFFGAGDGVRGLFASCCVGCALAVLVVCVVSWFL
jgi:hypothetical protein